MRLNQIDLIETIRGGNVFDITMVNGDKLDSLMNFYSGARLIDTAKYVNTDPSLDWKGRGGILAECTCRAIFDTRRDNGKEALFLYSCTPERDRQIVKAADLTENDRTMVSLIPNPAQGMQYVMKYILGHDIAQQSDGSQGCITIKHWNTKYKYLFQLGDKMTFILRRDMAWQQPDEYLLPGGRPC